MTSPKLQRLVFLTLLTFITMAFFWVISPFFGAVFWALVLAMIFWPLQRRMRIWLGGRDTLAATATLLICLAIVVVPLIFIVGAFVDQASSLSHHLRTGNLDLRSYFVRIIDALPQWAHTLLDRFGLNSLQDIMDRLTASLADASRALTTHALAIGQNTLMLLVNLGILLYLLFFFLRDGGRMARAIGNTIPMESAHTRYLLEKFATVVRATVKGTLVIALVQGILGGAAFAVLGINGALVWGTVMAVLSMVPAIGPALIWGPVAIYLIATGSYTAGIGLIVWGGVVMGLADNLLRPLLVGKETKLPDFIVLVTTIGGLSLFGINGFVIGPAIAALFLAAWALFAQTEIGVEDTSAPTLLDAVNDDHEPSDHLG